MKYLAQISAAGLLLGVVWVSTTRHAVAQDVSNKLVTVEYQSADVRQAFRKLLGNAGVSYTIDPAVQGSVTISLQNVTLDTALKNLSRQVDATYRVEGGVYQIVPAAAPPAPVQPQNGGGFGGGGGGGFGGQGGFGGGGMGGGQMMPPGMGQQQGGGIAMQMDGKFIYLLRGPVLYKINKDDLKVVKMQPLPMGMPMGGGRPGMPGAPGGPGRPGGPGGVGRPGGPGGPGGQIGD